MFKFLSVVIATIVGGNPPNDHVSEPQAKSVAQPCAPCVTPNIAPPPKTPTVVANDTPPAIDVTYSATDKKQTPDEQRSDSARRLTPQEKYKIERDVAQENATSAAKSVTAVREKIENAVVAPPGSAVDYRTTARNQAYNGNKITYEEQYRLDRGLTGKRLTPAEQFKMDRDVAQHNATQSTKPPAKKR